jgi:zinc/manganese transport system permease protein
VTDVLIFLAAPTVMCLVLALIHCYLGLHVLARGVIFVDLSLAQVASFGATFALLFVSEHDSVANYFISLGSTFLAAGLFALARRFEKHFSQEAVIGIVYALASAAVVLVVDRLAHGAEHLKEALVGQVLWVSWPEVFKTIGIYAAVGTIHYIYRDKFLAASTGERSHWIWDFLFYALFGVVITSSTHIAGVLMVFSYLIVPAILGSVFFESIQAKLIFGWLLSAVVSVVGMLLSYTLDLPVGAFIVVLMTSIPILVLIGFGIFGLGRLGLRARRQKASL